MPGPLPPPANFPAPYTQPVLHLGTLPPAKSGCQGVESLHRSCVWVGEIVGGLKKKIPFFACLCFLICLSWACIELVPRKYF